MALREDQILRYSRQILLKDVGGRGQEALLEAGVRLEGDGPARSWPPPISPPGNSGDGPRMTRCAPPPRAS